MEITINQNGNVSALWCPQLNSSYRKVKECISTEAAFRRCLLFRCKVREYETLGNQTANHAWERSRLAIFKILASRHVQTKPFPNTSCRLPMCNSTRTVNRILFMKANSKYRELSGKSVWLRTCSQRPNSRPHLSALARYLKYIHTPHGSTILS